MLGFMLILLEAKESLLSQVCRCGYIDVCKAFFHAESHVLWAKLMVWSFLQMSEGTTSCCTLSTLTTDSEISLLVPNSCFS